MGIVFVLLFWAFVFCVTIFPLAFLASLIGKRVNRKLRFKRILLGSVSFLIITFVLNLAISSIIGADIGLGDDFHVRIRNDYSLEFVDIPTNGGIYKGDECIISGVDGISVRRDSLYLLINDECVLLDMASGNVMHNISKPTFEIEDATSYYYDRYWKTGGVGLILSALVATVISVILTRKLIC